MNGSPLRELLDALAEGLARPRHAWEAVVIGVALAAGWVLARSVRSRVEARLTAAAHAKIPLDVLKFSIEGARRLAFPATALLLLWAGELAMRTAGLIANAADARLLRLAMALIGALAVVRLVVYAMRRALINVELIGTFERGIALTVWGVTALYVTGVLTDVTDWLEATRIPIGKTMVSLWAIFTGVTTTLVCLLAAMWIGSLVETRLMAAPGLDRNFRVVLGRVARAALMLIALLAALGLSGIDLTVLSVFGGALGVGLGLGLQRIASNYVSGFILLLDRSLRIGDLISVAGSVDRYYGTVTQINTRYTLLRAMDGTESVIPNEMLVSSPVVNHSLSDRRVRLAVRVSIAYESDLDLALRLGEEAARSTERVLADPPPGSLLVEFGADGLLLEIGFWIEDPEQGRMNVQSAVAIAVYKLYSDKGIAIPYPRRDVRVLAGSVPDAGGREGGQSPPSGSGSSPGRR
ncbi:MAG TPA: mechanosensitive ion channel domain-containing protein [Burkholderiaceae bacterium]|nr:mechanosensitive ion channel domain-containing protein [Burkholderiaceae bacterium]